MEQYSELINVLNDLIYINKDRVRELNKRITDLGNDFKYSRLLEQLIKQSLEFTDQLIHEVRGWDFPMVAMDAARFGHPDQAVNMLLYASPRFSFDEHGFVGGGNPYPHIPSMAACYMLWR